jgi:hypothetical protein
MAAHVSAPEVEVPSRELACTGQAVIVIAPVFPGKRRIAAIDGQPRVRVERVVSLTVLAKDPGPYQGPARRHHGGAACAGAQRLDVVPVEHVSVADDRDGHARRHVADGIPVGRRAVPRVPGAAVNRQRIRAAVGDGARLIQRVPPVVVPAKPDLRGDGNAADRPLHRLDEATLPARLTAQRGAESLVREMIDRAAAVEVDELCPA